MKIFNHNTSVCCGKMDVSERNKLVNTIKGVHEHLRRSLIISGDPNEVWNEHVSNENLRKEYASAMKKLATEVWDEKECRIHWSYKICLDYFLNGGIERSLLRELKLKHNWSPSQNELLRSLCIQSEQENNYKKLSRKLKLLDVGSCYNPFSKYSVFSCIAIDLTPATEDVMQCDFLKQEVEEKVKEAFCDEVEIFTAENFDVVVFSLVLEYLPAKEQRIYFCSKAWKLLQKNGLLIIITPDSKSLQHNAPMIKSWKTAIEKIGFIRIKYEKLKHLHGMAFRKIYKYDDIDLMSLSHFMYIPQDFKKYENIEKVVVRTDVENNDIYMQFSELPNEN